MKRQIFQTITLEQLRSRLGNTQVIRRFAESYDMVYFGNINLQDEARLVKGLTLSRTQQDAHYCVGTTHGHDVMFVQRSDSLKWPGERKESYTWNILVVDMKDQVKLPHVYLEGKKRHGKAFYETLNVKHRELSEIPTHLLAGYDPMFGERFTCRTPVVQAANLPVVLKPITAATLSHHFTSYDFEWFEDTVYVYYLSHQPSRDKLNDMVRAGIWLADEFEKIVQD